jgi:hypothetical protein
MTKTSALGACWIVFCLAPGIAYAQYPPPQSAQDAACRNYARDRVMSDPNPRGLRLEVLGRQYWDACMRRSQPARSKRPAKPKRPRR